MCTVVIDVAEAGARLLAVRDEDPQRAWDPVGEWWPDRPGVVGVRDRRAGGAWLAAHPDSGRLAVLLNRADVLDERDDLDVSGEEVLSRGQLVLDSVVGISPGAAPRTHGFNLLEVTPDGSRVLSWDGTALQETVVPPGVHMIAHDGLDDPATARIARWLPAFQAEPASHRADWMPRWLDLLGRTAELPPEDDAAIIRDNRPHGYSTQSLLYCFAAVDAAGVRIRDAALPAAGRWRLP